jgi:hypothetical protein
VFLEETWAMLPKYFFGAGLGRWGMISFYFGKPGIDLWAEVQFSAWLYDGGVLLIILYAVALYLACRTSWRIAIASRTNMISHWGAVIFGYNIGVTAILFVCPVFTQNLGMEFWLLNAALFAVAGSPENDGKGSEG